MTFKRLLLLMVLSFVAIASACGADSDKANKDNKGTDLSGSVVIDGSGTVYPLMARLAEEYMLEEQTNVSVEVSRSGTSAGFKKFLVADGSHLNNASREIKDEEITLAKELGIETKELKVALDGLTFVIHQDNAWAKTLTEAQLIEIFKADGNISTWADIDPDFPSEAINRYGPNENHGTYEFFWENILNKNDLVPSISLQQDYSTLVSLVSEDINGIAFFGYGYFVNNQDKLQAVHVDFGAGPIAPSLDTIAEDGDYAPFTRPVFTYLNVDHAKEHAHVLDYARFLVKNMNAFASETGFAPLPESEVSDYILFFDSLK